MTQKFIYVTWPNKELAVTSAKTLLEENLIACANIIKSSDSLFIWEGKLNHINETLMFIKADAKTEEKVIARIKELHPYEVPCIISLDISNGNQEFLKWISTI